MVFRCVSSVSPFRVFNVFQPGVSKIEHLFNEPKLSKPLRNVKVRKLGKCRIPGDIAPVRLRTDAAK